MPQPAQYHDEEGESSRPLARGLHSTQGNENVIPEPIDQRDVPVPPKFRHSSGKKWFTEILRHLDSDQQSEADGNIRITREIKIEVKVE